MSEKYSANEHSRGENTGAISIKPASEEWKDTKYKNVFEEELRGLERRRESDPNCRVEDIQAVLNNLYIMDGADSGGRGALQDVTMSATIAAYERFIAQWQSVNKL